MLFGMHRIRWHIGCSGFHYKEWKENFYPKGLPQSKWFDFYTQHFNTLELNVTFYRFPSLKSLQGWHDKAPDHFSISAKVPRNVTHYKKFEGTETELSDFYAVLKEGLSEKLACVLFQLPPQFNYDSGQLQKIIAQVDPLFDNVIEFRHQSWWRQDVFEQLSAHNISFCGVSFPKISIEDAIINTPLAYYRFHGVPQLFYSSYNTGFIQKIHQQIDGNDKVEKAYVYFNNTASMAAIANAKEFHKLTK
jgi:uncharacterized protein YecE (DUF72 family)